MKYNKVPVLFLAAAMSTHTLVVADDDDDEVPFDEARLFFELNDTDGDLGIHGKVDGDAWKYLEIEDTRERNMAKIWVRGRLRRQGLTELFFESAEPCFDPDDCDDALDPEVFFRRFPEGEYEIEGYTLDWEERESDVYLSHIIPAAPDNVQISGNGSTVSAPEDCDAELPVVDPAGGIVISWDQVDSAHEELGTPLEDYEVLPVRYYEVVVEIDESDFKSSSIIPPGDGSSVSWTIPEDFFELAEGEDGVAEYKFEILVRTNILGPDGEVVTAEVETDDGIEEVEVPGNKTAMESCFLVPAED